jgi:hypothetical protein
MKTPLIILLAMLAIFAETQCEHFLQWTTGLSRDDCAFTMMLFLMGVLITGRVLMKFNVIKDE